jgi:hypothetical protein
MVRDSTAGRRGVGCNKQVRDHRRPLADPLERDDRCQAPLHIMAAQRLLDRGDLALDLDDQHGPRRRVPREDVDGAAFAEPAE